MVASDNRPDASEPEPPVVLASELGYAGKHLHIRRDRVRLPTGRDTVREVLEHPGAVAILPLTTDGRLLLIRQYHHPIGQSLLGIPAGTMEPNEDPADTARRELEEETGYTAGHLTRLASYFTSPGYTSEEMILYRADDCRPMGGAPNPDELIRLAAVPLGDLPRLIAPGQTTIRDAKTLIALLWLLAHPV